MHRTTLFLSRRLAVPGLLLLSPLWARDERVLQAGKILGARSGPAALSLAVVRDGKVEDVQRAGVLGDGSRGKVDERTVFRACSLSKPVFAYLALRLADEGLLNLDRPLATPDPRVGLAGYEDLSADPRLKRLTARLLLTHRGGLPNWRWQRPDRKLVFEREPGTSFSYSGEGYRLLQTVVEAQTGRDLDELCRQYVFGPLGMQSSRFLLAEGDETRLSFDLGAVPPRFRTQIERERNSAGSLLTTAEDYARFVEAVMSGRGLRRQTHAIMLEPAVAVRSRALFGPDARQEREEDGSHLSWCLGWAFCNGPLGEAYFHVGAEEGFENFAVFLPRKRAGLVALSSGAAAQGVVREVVALAFGETGIPFDWMGYLQR